MTSIASRRANRRHGRRPRRRTLAESSRAASHFLPLVNATAERFNIKEVSADKAYLSAENVDGVARHGGTAFILPKSNTTGGVGGLFEKMVRYFESREEDFLSRYHKRPNVESTFSAIKRKFGDSLTRKHEVAMVNEALCQLLCHNICCLIQEQCELGIEPVFWPKEEKPEQPARAPVERQIRVCQRFNTLLPAVRSDAIPKGRQGQGLGQYLPGP